MLTVDSYTRVRTVAEALRHLPAARIIAGGTDLISTQTGPVAFVDISQIETLQGVTADKQGLQIGAATKIKDVARSKLLRGGWRMVAEAAAHLGSAQVRSMGTIGGNLCNASPAADTAVPLLALEASVKLLSPGGERTLPLNDFFIGPHQTAQMADELLTAILLPALPPGAVGIYLRYSLRNAVNPAIVSVAVLAAPGGTVRIALGAAEPKPVRAYQAEQQAGPLTEEAILAAAALVADTAHPIDDIRASAEYRRAMLKLFTERALRQAKNMLHEKKEA